MGGAFDSVAAKRESLGPRVRGGDEIGSHPLGSASRLPPRAAQHQSGALLLEIVLVVVLVSLLFLVAYERLLPMRGQAEGATVTGSIGAMQASLGAEVAARVLRQGSDALLELDRSNPVDFLIKPPGGYQGASAGLDPASLPPGGWGFDSSRGVLVYRVRYPQYFDGSLLDPARAEWRVELRYGSEQADPHDIRGVLLVPLSETRWLVDAI
jgi:type II secretory pathway pseudopilin PulG